MNEWEIDADELVDRLLSLSGNEPVFLLDSCGVERFGSNKLIAGISPVEVLAIPLKSADASLDTLNSVLSRDRPAIFFLTYDFGRRLAGIPTRNASDPGPEVLVATFDSLVVHDYRTNRTHIIGSDCDEMARKIDGARPLETVDLPCETVSVTSNFDPDLYVSAVEEIKELIREGQTYQTNLTQQLTAQLNSMTAPEQIFLRLRREHPAPFSAFIKVSDFVVVSASPERFLSVAANGRDITTSPIKGTRRRGKTPAEDLGLIDELIASEKDRAENVMIVDLLRNDLGRICEFGTIAVETLCAVETHPTYHHLVSTINGRLRKGTSPGELLRSLFPCGSITGAPKFNTMKIIDSIESAPRGLSMGAIGFYIPPTMLADNAEIALDSLSLSVAIRTMMIRDGVATFNVGGGITIDSEPVSEYEESLVKAAALLNAVNGRLE